MFKRGGRKLRTVEVLAIGVLLLAVIFSGEHPDDLLREFVLLSIAAILPAL